MKITCKYQVLFGQVQVQVQVLWHFHTPSTQVHQVLINMYLSTSTKYKYCTWPQPWLIHSIVLYCIVLYCIMRPYTDGPIGPLSYRHSSGVVRNPHSTLAEWGIFNLRSMSSQGTHLLIARRRNSINSVLVTISWMTCLIATREPRTINLSIAGERITFTM